MLGLSDTALAILVTGLVQVIIAFFNLIIGLRNSSKSDAIAAKTEVISSSVNGAANAQVAHVAELQKELQHIREVAAERKETLSLLAVSRPLVVAAPLEPTIPPIAPTLPDGVLTDRRGKV